MIKKTIKANTPYKIWNLLSFRRVVVHDKKNHRFKCDITVKTRELYRENCRFYLPPPK